MIPIEDIKKIAAGEEVTLLVKPTLATVEHGTYWMRIEDSFGKMGRWEIVRIAEFSWRRKKRLMVVGWGYSCPADSYKPEWKIELVRIQEPPQ